MIHEVDGSNSTILRYIIFVLFGMMWSAVRDPVVLFDPGAEVDQTAALGAERPVVVVDPDRQAMTLWT